MGYSATGTFETFGVNSLSEPTWDKKEHFEIKQNVSPPLARQRRTSCKAP